jgi:glycosyltransferase involved in cell wall biosynthesis
MRVSLFYVDPRPGDAEQLPERVELRPVERPDRKRGLLTRLLGLHREFEFLADAALAVHEGCDLVYANDYPTLAPARRIARRLDAPLLYDSHEIYLETVNQFFPSGAGPLRRLAFRCLTGLARARGRRVERELLSETDLLVTTNAGYADHFRRAYGVSETTVVMNCPARDAVPERRRPAGRGGTVLYQGVMNLGRGLPELVRSTRWLDPGLRLVLIGYGMLEPELRRIAFEEGLGERVEFRGRIEYEELLHHTVAADLGVLVLDPVNLSKRLSSANKVFEYMACGTPVLATDLPENRRVLAECDAGWLVETREPRRLAAEVNRIFGDREEMRRRGENGRRAFAAKYNWERQEARLLDAVERLLRGAEP